MSFNYVALRKIDSTLHTLALKFRFTIPGFKAVGKRVSLVD